jgi:hypothetical protein
MLKTNTLQAIADKYGYVVDGKKHTILAFVLNIGVRPIFGYHLPEVGHFLKSDEIHLANDLGMPSAASSKGYRRQESVTIPN